MTPRSLKPTFTLDVAITNTVFGTPTWVNIAAYVLMRPMKITRGRNYEADTFEAGSLDGVVLDNSDGRFSPNNTSGPYYGYILPLKQIRLTVTHSGVTYTKFRGFITAWTPEITLDNRRKMPVVALTITDIFGLLAQIDIKEYDIEDSELLTAFTHVETSFDLQPTEYRTIAIIGDAAAIAGNLTLSGFQLETGALQSEAIALNGTTEVRSANRYKSVTSVTYPARTAVGQHVRIYTAGFADEYAQWAQYHLFENYEIPVDRQTFSGIFQVILEDQPASGETLLGRVQKMGITEGGRVYVDHNGVVIQEARYVRSLATLTAIFSDVVTTGYLTYDEVSYSLDDTHLVNTVEYQTPGGQTRYSQDTVSVAAFGRRYGSIPALYDNGSILVTQIAALSAKRYSTPVERINKISFRPNSQPDNLWTIALGMEISQYYRVINTPPSGTTRDNYVFVERIEETFTAQLVDWQTTLTLSPENVNVFFVLDRDALDNTTRLLGY